VAENTHVSVTKLLATSSLIPPISQVQLAYKVPVSPLSQVVHQLLDNIADNLGIKDFSLQDAFLIRVRPLRAAPVNLDNGCYGLCDSQVCANQLLYISGFLLTILVLGSRSPAPSLTSYHRAVRFHSYTGSYSAYSATWLSLPALENWQQSGLQQEVNIISCTLYALIDGNVLWYILHVRRDEKILTYLSRVSMSAGLTSRVGLPL
jgi:hypothetical protein